MAFNLDDVRRAWDDKNSAERKAARALNPTANNLDLDDMYAYVREVWTDHVIVEGDRKRNSLTKYPFTVNPMGEITFGTGIPVKQEYVELSADAELLWVDATWSLQNKTTSDGGFVSLSSEGAVDRLVALSGSSKVEGYTRKTKSGKTVHVGGYSRDGKGGKGVFQKAGSSSKGHSASDLKYVEGKINSIKGVSDPAEVQKEIDSLEDARTSSNSDLTDRVVSAAKEHLTDLKTGKSKFAKTQGPSEKEGPESLQRLMDKLTGAAKKDPLDEWVAGLNEMGGSDGKGWTDATEVRHFIEDKGLSESVEDVIKKLKAKGIQIKGEKAALSSSAVENLIALSRKA
jgi:hypothetical protein